MKKNTWLTAVVAGMVAAIAEGCILTIAGSETRLTILQSMLAWFACGLVVSLANTRLPVLIESLLLTWLINAAWIVALSYNGGKPEHMLPLVVASGAMGLLIGLVRMSFARLVVMRQALCLTLAATAVTFTQRCSVERGPFNAGVIEVAKFRKKADVSEGEFLAAMRSIDSFAEKQPGFISREMGPDGRGGWIDVVKWRDQASAHAAMKAAEKSEICAKAFSLLDPKFEEMNHITVEHRFGK